MAVEGAQDAVDDVVEEPPLPPEPEPPSPAFGRWQHDVSVSSEPRRTERSEGRNMRGDYT